MCRWTAGALFVLAALVLACASEEEGRRTAADRPETTLDETADPREKVLCIRAQAAPFDAEDRKRLLA
jgi:hypothetical protein